MLTVHALQYIYNINCTVMLKFHNGLQCRQPNEIAARCHSLRCCFVLDEQLRSTQVDPTEQPLCCLYLLISIFYHLILLSMLLFAPSSSSLFYPSRSHSLCSIVTPVSSQTPIMPPPLKRQKKDTRCSWSLSTPQYIEYHDKEWGVPLYDNHKTFEFIILETFQAGLSWRTILNKRESFRKAFLDFDVDNVSQMTEKDVSELLQNKSIVRNKLKIRAAIANAKATIKLRDEGVGLADYFWNWVQDEPQCNYSNGTCPSNNHLSDQISKDMKERGFKFVGSTVIYAHLQATGVVNDHIPSCPRFQEVKKLLRKQT